MSKVAVFFATGYEEIEALTVVDILRRADVETPMVSITQERCVTGSHSISVAMDAVLTDINFDELDMIVLPGGGLGTQNLEACEALMAQVDTFVAQGKPVAAICAAPSVLGDLGILKGKRAACYPGFEERLAGAEVVYEKVAVDSNVTTSRAMGTAVPFALALAQQLASPEKAEEIKKGILYGHA